MWITRWGGAGDGKGPGGLYIVCSGDLWGIRQCVAFRTSHVRFEVHAVGASRAFAVFAFLELCQLPFGKTQIWPFAAHGIRGRRKWSYTFYIVLQSVVPCLRFWDVAKTLTGSHNMIVSQKGDESRRRQSQLLWEGLLSSKCCHFRPSYADSISPDRCRTSYARGAGLHLGTEDLMRALAFVRIAFSKSFPCEGLLSLLDFCILHKLFSHYLSYFYLVSTL